MDHSGERRGICSTCQGVETCTFPFQPGKNLLHCDEFEPWPPRSGSVAFRSGGLDRPTVDYRTTTDRPRPLGLCSNCENRVGCTFPRPDGGVWRCEEYL